MDAWSTAAVTVLGGTTVYVSGQLFSKLIFEPALELRKTIGLVATALTEYANLYSSAGATHDFLIQPSIEASKSIRRLAAQMQAQAYGIIGYGVLQKLSVVPPRDDVIAAVKELIGLSNSFPGMAVATGQAFINIKTAATIERLLRLYGRRDAGAQPGN